MLVVAGVVGRVRSQQARRWPLTASSSSVESHWWKAVLAQPDVAHSELVSWSRCVDERPGDEKLSCMVADRADAPSDHEPHRAGGNERSNRERTNEYLGKADDV